MWKRLILKMGIKNLVLSTLWSQVFSQKNIFWGPYFLDNLMIKSTKEKLHVKKMKLLTEYLEVVGRCEIIVQVQYWKLVTRSSISLKFPLLGAWSLLEIKRPWRKWTRKLQLPSLLEKWWWGDNQCVAFLLKCFLCFIKK